MRDAREGLLAWLVRVVWVIGVIWLGKAVGSGMGSGALQRVVRSWGGGDLNK